MSEWASTNNRGKNNGITKTPTNLTKKKKKRNTMTTTMVTRANRRKKKIKLRKMSWSSQREKERKQLKYAQVAKRLGWTKVKIFKTTFLEWFDLKYFHNSVLHFDTREIIEQITPWYKQFTIQSKSLDIKPMELKHEHEHEHEHERRQWRWWQQRLLNFHLIEEIC